MKKSNPHLRTPSEQGINPFQKRSFMKVIVFSIAWICVIFSWAAVMDAATFFRYKDQNGTVVLTDRINEVPPEFRQKLEEIVIPDPTANNSVTEKKSPLPLEDVSKALKDSQVGEKQIRAARAGLASFFKDRKLVLVAYGLGAIVLWGALFFLLKKCVGGLAAKIVMNLVVMAVLFSGAYVIYLSWLNKTVLDIGQNASGNKTIMDRLTTPKDLVDQTQKMVDQLNRKSEAHQERLREIGNN